MTAAILFVLRFLILNIDRAQANILVLLLLLYFTYYLIKRNDTLAGIYLGIGMIFKLTPVIFLVYLAFKKRFKALFVSVATFGALLFIPSFRWGLKRNAELIAEWAGVLGMTFPSEYLQHKNQSLMAAISRLFSGNSDIAIAGLEGTCLTGLIAAIYAGFMFVLIYCVMRKSREMPDADTEALYDLALFFTAMTVLSPVGTKATFIYILLPVALLIKEAFDRKLKDKVLDIGLLSYVGLVYLNSSDIIGKLSVTLHKYSLMTVSLLLIFSLTVYAKFRKT